MLKKIIVVRNVGRFVSSALPGVSPCAKYTQILGANGYGKTTLCAIVRSLATNDPALIVGRTRVGSKAGPQVELLLDRGIVKFDNGAWSADAPEIIVFDGAFIAENVHSGDAVDLEQKRNLYRVIVGKQGVGLAFEEERLAGESRGKGGEIKTTEKAIQSHLPQGMKLEEFLKLTADPEIDVKIITQTKALDAIREAAQLKARPALAEAPFPVMPPTFEAILGKTLAGIAEDAQKRIAQHIKHHGMSEDAEAWIAEGMDHISGDSCPFCGQSLQGLALIDAYRTVFAETYRDMKTAVADARAFIERDFGDRVIGSLETLIETNRSGAEFWGRYCKLPELYAPTEASKAITTLREAAVSLLFRKSAAPQDAVAIDSRFTSAREKYEPAQVAIEKYNAGIKTGNAEIAAKKAAVAGGDLKKEEIALARLIAQKKRHDPEVAPICTANQTLTRDKDALDKRKAAIRDKLEEHTRKVIKPYEARINELLDHFNAGFRIAETKPAYPGGVASSTYQLVINKTGIDLGDGKTPLDRPSFKNTLSAGDRSTLALAFFLAHLERDPDRATRIVVFDDPFTSQDTFRRRQTIYEIKRAGAACEQVIVLSHDATFLRQVRDKCPTAESISLQLADHRDLGIKIAPCDLDEACRGRAASEMDDLQAYAMTGAGKDRDIIKKMRIVLETYCRSTYTGSFTPTDRLGGMVEKVKKDGDKHPAWSAVDELEQINDYSRDHHHGDDPTDGSGDLIDAAELEGFVRRTLRLVNNLQA
jgi:wobble nucleotide-excising tRNase